MKFFIDTANLEQIREAYDLGVLDGVTTNPSLMAKEGIKGVENQRKHYVDICNIVQGDVSAEVIATDYEGMIKEGEELAALKDKPFLQLSSGEQRLALLARAFVKDPELLILDEPLHGLDTYNRRRVKKIIEAFCHRRDKTMIMVTHYENELPQTITNRLFLKRNR